MRKIYIAPVGPHRSNDRYPDAKGPESL